MPELELELQHDSLSYYLSLPYPIDLYPESQGFTVMMPDLPGCISQGTTIDEAIINIDRAKHIWLETVYATDKTSIPLPSKPIPKK
jgi:antitoxin HicB